MRDYTKLEIYKEAFDLTRAIYELTNSWPKVEIYCLTQQVRQSVHSVDSNICEGASRNSDADCLRFIYTAFASLKETENHLKLAFALGYITKEVYSIFLERITRLSKMINSFIQSLRYFAQSPKPNP